MNYSRDRKHTKLGKELLDSRKVDRKKVKAEMYKISNRVKEVEGENEKLKEENGEFVKDITCLETEVKRMNGMYDEAIKYGEKLEKQNEELKAKLKKKGK